MREWGNRETATERREIIDFHKMKAEDVIKLLRSDLNLGLKGAEVERRLKEHGYNEVPEEKINPVVRFVKKFWGLTAWMLEIIIILLWILQKYSDLYIVTALLFFNSILGFAEEQKASSAVEALKKRLQVNARVFRDGVWGIVPARELVPGDIIRVRSGDFVPADVKIIMGELGVDQSALTGESMEVEKKSDDILYSGSVVRRGEANGVVILTGVKTYFGRTTQLVQIARPKLHMEEIVSKVVKWLLVIVVTLLGIAIIFSMFEEINLLEILPLMLVLLLGAIPVALPAMFTVSMAIGSMELVKKGVLVTRLSASEDAATMDILCVDKTGTMTMNKLSIVNVTPLNGYSEQEVIFTLAIAKTDDQNQPNLVGLVALYDVPRPDSKKFIEELKGLGVSVKMLTGDALPIAKEIAKDVGLGENVIKISDLKGFLKEDPAKAAEIAEKSDGFAEIYPEDKYTIVKSLQAKGHVVGMTGDGVNDAPALRQAEVGIAVSNATDVAKGAASVVLTSEGLWILNKIMRTIQKTVLVVLAFLITGKYIISAFAMILNMFLTDFVKISLSTDNVRPSREPDTWDITGLVKVALVLSSLMVVESLGLLYIGFKYLGLMTDDQSLYAFTFQILNYSAIFSVFNVRERRHFWNSMPSKTLLTSLIADIIVATIISTVGIPGLKAMPLIQTLSVIVYFFIFSLIVNDLIKFILVKKTGVRW